MKARPSRAKTVGLVAAFAVAAAAAACSAILGVTDLPPATGAVDASLDAPREASRPDAKGTDARTADAGHDASVHEAGDAHAAPFTVTPAALAFGNVGGVPGLVPCGTTATPLTFTVSNNSDVPLVWWALLGLGAASPFQLSSGCTTAAPCVQNAGTQRTVTVTPPPVPALAGMTTYEDSLTVFWGPGGTTVSSSETISLKQASYGSVLAFLPPDVNFGQQPANQRDGGYPESVEIENTGNAPFRGTIVILPSPRPVPDGGLPDAGSPDGGSLDATVDTGQSEFAVSPAQVEVPPKGLEVTTTFNPRGTIGSASGTVALDPGDASVLCGTLPSALTLEGQGTVSPVSVTSSLNFNAGQNGNVGVSCGSAGPPLNVVVTNAGAASVHVTGLSLARGAGSQFVVSSAGLPQLIPGATDAGAGSVMIPLTTQAIPANAPAGSVYADTLTVTTDAAGDLPHRVALNMTAAGVVLSLSLTEVQFSSTAPPNQTRFNLFLTNSGNVACLAPTAAITGTGASVFTWPSNLSVPQYFTSQFTAEFTPTANGSFTGASAITVSPGTPVCGGFTGTIPVSFAGTAQTPVTASVQPLVLNLGNAICAQADGGGAFSHTQNVDVLSPASLGAASWSASLSGAGASYFTATPSSGTGEQGKATMALGVEPLSSTSGLTSVQSAFGIYALLTINATFTMTGETDVFNIPVYAEPQGAYPTWSSTQLDVPRGGSAAFSLFNASPQPSGFAFAAASSFSITPPRGNSWENQFLNAQILDVDAGVGATTSITATLSNMTQPVCGPLPAPLPVTVVSP